MPTTSWQMSLWALAVCLAKSSTANFIQVEACFHGGKVVAVNAASDADLKARTGNGIGGTTQLCPGKAHASDGAIARGSNGGRGETKECELKGTTNCACCQAAGNGGTATTGTPRGWSGKSVVRPRASCGGRAAGACFCGGAAFQAVGRIGSARAAIALERENG